MNRQPYHQQNRRPVQPASAPRAPLEQSKLPVIVVLAVNIVDAGNLLAFADLQIGRGPNAVTVCSWRLIQQPGQTAWVSGPQETWNDPQTGERRYKNLFVYPSGWRNAITNAIVAGYEEAKRQAAQQEGRHSD